MSVAPSHNTSPTEIQEGDFAHAVDNPRYSTSAVVSGLAFERWWQPDPLAPGRGRGCIGYQPRDRPARGLNLKGISKISNKRSLRSHVEERSPLAGP